MQATALLMAAVLATLYVFYGPWRAGIVVASLVIAVSLFWLRKIARGLYGAIEVLIGFVAILDASTKGRGGFSAGFSSGDFQRYEWSVILLQTAAAIYLTIRGLDNLEQWWSDKRTGTVRE
jgi:hypothetical protein